MANREGKRSAKKVRGAKNSVQAVDLRIAGKSYEDIGKALGMTHQGARKAVARAMQRWAEECRESATELRDIESKRLDAAIDAVWKKIQAGDTQAILRLVQLSARRAALFGLDMPVRTEQWWSEIPPVDHAIEAHQLIASTAREVVFATAPWWSCVGWESACREWLHTYFGAKSKNVLITARKELVRADILVEDKVENLDAFKNEHPDGAAYLYDQPYNQATQAYARLRWLP